MGGATVMATIAMALLSVLWPLIALATTCTKYVQLVDVYNL